jgi:putative transposase
MARKRRNFSPEFKCRVALSALKNTHTLNELASEYELHPNQIREWKNLLVTRGPEVFVDGRTQKDDSDDQLISRLYEEIGRLKIELDWLHKKVCL